MRTLILMRGAPGSGKSTFIQTHGLKPYTIEPDAIRLMAQSPEYDIQGSIHITQKQDRFVWELLFKMLENRMQRGELIVIDATHSRTQQINKYRQLCKDYRYRVKLIDFSSIPLATCLSQNLLRPQLKQVPEDAIRSIHARLQGDKPGSWVEVIPYDQFDFDTHLQFQPFDASSYSQIKVYGDIHGCFDVLPQLDPDTLHIFVGDYLDRGIQNAQVFQFLLDHKDLPNTIFLEGNHERHWRTIILAKTFDVKLPKYTRKAILELQSAGYTISDLKSAYGRLNQAAYITLKGQTYIISHGGIPCTPSVFIPADDYIWGIGKYGDSEKVDQSFASNCSDLVSIHGHRNVFKVPTSNTSNTFNLCGDPEFGGHFRYLTIKDTDITPTLVPNTTFDTSLQTKPEVQSTKVKDITNIDPTSVLADFITSPFVNVKDLGSGIKSVNFTTKAFKHRKWNDLTIKARGLFLDDQSKVVARSYEKFFNYKEVDITKDPAIRALKYPLKVWNKENGFLGILSVYNNDWFIASKSTNTGPFADMFRDLITPYLTDSLKSDLTTYNCSLVFEVNHLSDPHIIEYTSSHLVLLDAIQNSLDYHNLPNLRNSIAFKHNFTTKNQATTLATYQDWRNFRESQQAMHPFTPNIEGWVIEDASGFQFKLKSNYYNFWKYMRSIKDRMHSRPTQWPEIKAKLHTESDFLVWNYLSSLPLEDLTKDIITLRKDFLCQHQAKSQTQSED